MAFPVSLPSNTDPTALNKLNSPSHSQLHQSHNAEIVAVETKVGTGASTPTSGKVLRATGTGTSSWGQVDLSTDATSLTSATLRGLISDETGTGSAVFGTSPTIATPTVTGGAFSSPTITTPKIVTSINDSNDNEIIKTPATAGAVNEITITNASTGNAPIIEATGGDTNANLVVRAKGNGLTKISVLRQDDTSNTYKHNSVFLSGWGFITATVASAFSEAVTFGITFAQRPIALATFGGDNIASATTYGSGSTARNNAYAEAISILTTGFTARLVATTNWTSGDILFYQWVAIGELT